MVGKKREKPNFNNQQRVRKAICERPTVERAEASHVAHGVSPRLPVLCRCPNVLAVELFGFGARLVIGAQSAQSTELLIRVQETCRVGEVVHHPPAEDSHEDGHETLDDD